MKSKLEKILVSKNLSNSNWSKLTVLRRIIVAILGLTQCLIYETLAYMITPLPQCSKEIADFPDEIRGELADALARLNEGHTLSMPLSRPMPSIGKGVHELRFRDRAGIYRVIYVLIGGGSIFLIHAFMKKAAKTPQPNIDLAKRRLKELGR